MKFIFGMFLLMYSFSSLSAETITAEKASQYEKAKTLFTDKKYEMAYDAFYKLFQENLQDPNINFYLGRTAYMLKKFDLSISAYERVLNIDENSIRVKLEIAKCYFELKRYEESKELFTQVLTNDLPTNVKQNINMYLSAIKAKTKQNFFSGSLVAGINYDTNIYNYANEQNDINTFNSTATIKDSLAHQEALALNHTYKISDAMNFKNSLILYSKSILEDHDRDIVLAQYTPALAVSYASDFIVDYALSFSRIWLGFKPFITYYGIHPRVKYIYSNTTSLETSLKYQKKDMDLVNTHLGTLDFTLQHIASDKLMLMLYSQLYSERKFSSKFTDIDYDMLYVALSGAYRYTVNINLDLKMVYSKREYKDSWVQDVNLLNTQEVRSDDEYQFMLNTTYSYSKHVLFNLNYIHTKHFSNIPLREFDKDSITTNVIVLF
ncbi:tetratricopeptide repeat protein [Sulfurimonas aquatica]|uniref:Tetratricopeptide repeat protein n=1 Tax=Sulfurimonas aquatica TaxID=2672570 RepID=A0A975AYD0_9BACT|nr:tetratricopeptide repeat protein [Sulfurimonas aquatica]QSZ40861.1 tetratricopeptide repeat protein [Sulfurimonas aquatica]